MTRFRSFIRSEQGWYLWVGFQLGVTFTGAAMVVVQSLGIKP